MGADIHLHTEIKISGEWHHYSVCKPLRNYALFAKMADIRNVFDIVPISAPKGLPGDVTLVTKIASAYDDGNSHSYLTSKEVVELAEWALKGEESPIWMENFDASKNWGYLFDNHWSQFYKYRDEYPDCVEDFRFVFWFDN